MVATMELMFRVVVEGEFEEGLQCPTCHRDIQVGQPYRSQIVGMTSTGGTIEVLMCVYCDLEEDA